MCPQRVHELEVQGVTVMKSGKCLGHRALAPEGTGSFFLAPTSIQDELLFKKKKR